jgi:large subunit ribosomal protein L22
MDVVSFSRYVRMSPSKARDLAAKLRGLPVAEALRLAEFSPRKAAFQISKTLKAAIANASNNAHLHVEGLRVKEAVIDEGPRMKRFWPRARGAVSPVLKRTCHVRVVVTDGRSD